MLFMSYLSTLQKIVRFQYDAVSSTLEPFAMKQLLLPFVIWIAGVLVSSAASVAEGISDIKNRRAIMQGIYERNSV